ncbi:MAG: hypothetical protein V3U24_09080 [Candidatus Neomarinimicrobiota bacterium]
MGFFLLGMTVSLSPGPSQDVDFKDLPEDGKRIVTYLKSDWKKRFRSTTIALAMENLGIQSDDELRIKVGQYFRDHPGLIKNLRFWGANNYILTDEEKLIAKFLINTYEFEEQIPGLNEAARALATSEERLKGRLDFMSKAGLLQVSGDEKLGYRLAEGFHRWGGPLRHNFHTVYLEGEKPFGVW